MEKRNDPPPHYDLDPQPWDVIRAWGLADNYWLGSALKYIARAGRKEGTTYDEDVQKAIDFLKEALR